jgi:multiple sugar transport system permease protein
MAPTPASTPVARPASGGQKSLSIGWMSWPAVLFVVALIVFPLIYAVWLSMQNVSLGTTAKFSGFDNYKELFAESEFRNAFKLTFVLYGVAIVMQLVVGTWLALVLNRIERFKNIIRTIAITPFLLPPVVVGMVAVVILDPSLGVANWVLAQFGIPPSLWLAHPKWVLFTVALLDTWQAAPFVALIVLGGLLSLPAKVFEAAEVDGAVGWRRFIYITLPLLGPTLLTAAILRSVDLLRFFDIIYITTRGGPGNASTTLNIYAYQQAFEFTRFGYASAAMVTLSSVVFGTVLVFAKLRKTVAW